MDPKQLAGSLKVAILIQSMGRESAQQVLNSLSDSERDLVESHLSRMGKISPQLAEKVAEEFTQMADEGLRQIREASGMPGEKENKQAAESSSRSGNLKALRSLEPDLLAELIKDEHPQTIAIIIVHLKSDVASEVLARLPDEIKTDVSLRIANLDKVISEMVEEIDKVFEDVLKNKEATETHKTGGVGRLAEILNQIDGASAQLILDEIEEQNPELAAEIKQRMFVFEDLILVDDQGLQKVLRRIESVELAKALKAASEEVKEKIFRNMSSRASEMLKEEIEALGAVRMKEVEDAQQAITKIIQDMEERGELVISGRRGEEFIA